MSEDIFQDIMFAIETWLSDISVLEERIFKIQTLRERIHRTISQVEYEGSTSTIDLARLNHVGDMWINLLDLLRGESNPDSKRTIIIYLLKLFECGELSLLLTTEMILKLHTF